MYRVRFTSDLVEAAVRALGKALEGRAKWHSHTVVFSPCQDLPSLSREPHAFERAREVLYIDLIHQWSPDAARGHRVVLRSEYSRSLILSAMLAVTGTRR